MKFKEKLRESIEYELCAKMGITKELIFFLLGTCFLVASGNNSFANKNGTEVDELIFAHVVSELIFSIFVQIYF